MTAPYTFLVGFFCGLATAFVIVLTIAVVKGWS